MESVIYWSENTENVYSNFCDCENCKLNPLNCGYANMVLCPEAEKRANN